MPFHEDQTSLLLFVQENMLEPSQGVLEPLGEHDTAVQTHAGCWGLQDWGCAVCVGAGGSALQGTGWVAKAGVFPACLRVSALASPGSQEQTGTEGCICLINDFVARLAQ